jgi:hypothetical protein
MTEQRSAIIAGSKEFVNAVRAPLKLRLGAAPHVTHDPQEALRACADTGGLLVVEYAGVPWLDAVRSARKLCGDRALSIVAAVPVSQEADIQSLQRAGVDEVVRWQGRADPVLWAIDRVIGCAPPERLAPARPDVQGVEKGFALRELPSSEAETASVAPAAEAPAPPAPPRVIPAAAEAEALLIEAAAGRASPDPGTRAIVDRALAAASDLERCALQGGAVSVDPVLLRTAAALRLRIEVAVAALGAGEPAQAPPGAQELLAEVDAVLAQVSQLASAAPAEALAAIDATRLSIVDGGVRLAGALSRLVPVGPAEVAVRPARPADKSVARVTSNVRAGEGLEGGFHGVPTPLWIALAIALAGVGGYHVWRLARTAAPPPATFVGAPTHTSGLNRGAVRILMSEPGKPIDPAELEKFKGLEQAKGNVVREIAKGTWAIEPAGTAEGGKKP